MPHCQISSPIDPLQNADDGMNNLSSAVGAPPIAFPGDAIMTFPVELGPSVRVPLARCAQLQVNFVSLYLLCTTGLSCSLVLCRLTSST